MTAVAELQAELAQIRRLLELVMKRLPDPPDLISTEEARTLYGLSRSALYRAAASGVLTRMKRPGRRATWWRREEVELYLEGREQIAEPRGRRAKRRHAR